MRHRKISIPQYIVQQLLMEPFGATVQVTVKVDWPELQLTQDEIMANAVAMTEGHDLPYPDRSVILIELPYPVPAQ